MVQPPAHCVFLKRFQRQDTCVYRHTFEHGWLSCICLCSHCGEWQCCVLGDTHTHTHTHPRTRTHKANAGSSDLKTEAEKGAALLLMSPL